MYIKVHESSGVLFAVARGLETEDGDALLAGLVLELLCTELSWIWRGLILILGVLSLGRCLFEIGTFIGRLLTEEVAEDVAVALFWEVLEILDFVDVIVAVVMQVVVPLADVVGIEELSPPPDGWMFAARE